MLLTLIKKTNGDILGIILFIFLIIYFINLDNKGIIEYLLLLGCIIGFIVDFYITYTTINKDLKKLND